MTGALQKSGEIMKLINNLIKLPEVASSMQEMSKEMMKVILQTSIGLNDH